MKAYADKAKFEKCKGIRQSIMATVAKHGYSLNWLHDNMSQWGFGESLRELSFGQLMEVRTMVVKCMGDDINKKTKKGE